MENPFQKTLERYIAIRGATLRPGTVELYRRRLNSLIQFLRLHHPQVDSFAKLRPAPHIEGWLQMLAKRQPPYKNSTRRSYIQHVRRFLEDIREWDWPDSPPPGLIRRQDLPPEQRYLPKPLPPEVDITLVRGLCARGDFVSLGLLLLRRTGLRIGELLRLELDCLVEDPDGHDSLRVPLGKVHRERVIPIDAETAALIKEIQRMRGERPATVDPETGRPVELLFCNARGQMLYGELFNRALDRIAESLGITQNVYPHRLRHTFATDLLRHGVSLPGVMKLLGHKTIKMTLRYVEVTNEDLGKNYLEALARAREHYALLTPPQTNGETEPQEPLEAMRAAFDELLARIQALRFDHPDPTIRKRLQRFVERLRRAQSELLDLLG